MSYTIERVARAICRFSENPDHIGPFTSDDGRKIARGETAWTAWVSEARAAIAAMNESDFVVCPFCKEVDFDLIGLRHHLSGGCDGFNQTEVLAKREF